MPKKPPISKRVLWLSYFLDKDNLETFFNATASARAAGIEAANPQSLWNQASQIKKSWEPEINQWLDEQGLSREHLKKKLIDLLDAKETKFFAHMGTVIDQRTVRDTAAQLKALDMALKVKGEYKDKIELSGADGGPLDMSLKVVFVNSDAAKENEDLL